MTYSLDGQPTSMKELRRIASLHVGSIAYHVPVTDVIKILKNQNMEVRRTSMIGTTFKIN